VSRIHRQRRAQNVHGFFEDTSRVRNQQFICTLAHLLLTAHASCVLALGHSLVADRRANDSHRASGSTSDRLGHASQ
jgi:hypothetical protein